MGRSTLEDLKVERGIQADREQFHIEDVSIPDSPEKMRSVLDRIKQGVDDDCLVYVHCLGGHGRTGIRQHGGPEKLGRLGAGGHRAAVDVQE